ncbi:hypothetical protein BH10PSE18_BH10PSE18_45350 [soil metagenome]|jgi:hypothetical protein
MKSNRSRQKPLALPGPAVREPERRAKAAQSLRKPLLIDYQSWMALTAGIARAAAKPRS